MKKLILVAVSALLLAGLFAGVDGMAGNADKAIAKFEKKLDKLVGQCVKQLEKANSAGDMDEIAQDCEEDVFELLADLEEELGHEIDFESFYICVYNANVGHEACFDPIIITGGS